MKHIDSLVINPSKNFNTIALKYFHKLPLSVRLLIRMVGITNDSESSIVSYLLFDKDYCRELMTLGFDDTMKQESEIRTFLNL